MGGSGSTRQGARIAEAYGEPLSAMMEWWLRNRGDLDDYVDQDVARSCTSKAAYDTETAARAAIAMQGLSGKLHTYACRYCASWHLTRRDPSTPPRRTDTDDEDDAE